MVDTAQRLARLATNGSIAASSASIEEFEKSKPNLSQNIITRKYNETLNTARSKNLEVYKVIIFLSFISALFLFSFSSLTLSNTISPLFQIVISSLDYQDTLENTLSMPHVVLSMGDEQMLEMDGIETISINKKEGKESKSNWLIGVDEMEIGESIGRGNLGTYFKGRLKSKEVLIIIIINYHSLYYVIIV